MIPPISLVFAVVFCSPGIAASSASTGSQSLLIDSCTASAHGEWMDPDPSSYSLDQLRAQASCQLGEDLNPRTIRLYATEGLIDRPGRDGRHAVYGERQLRQLLLIRSLAQRGLSLSAIAPLAAASDDDLDAQLADLLPEAPDAIAAAMPPPLIEENQALAYLQELPSTAARGRSSSRRRLSSTPTTSSHWQRFVLAPGVELHLSDDVAIPPPGRRRQRWLQQLNQALSDHIEQSNP